MLHLYLQTDYMERYIDPCARQNNGAWQTCRWRYADLMFLVKLYTTDVSNTLN